MQPDTALALSQPAPENLERADPESWHDCTVFDPWQLQKT
jgi:hypothetical protein